jgi:hypothetical protein
MQTQYTPTHLVDASAISCGDSGGACGVGVGGMLSEEENELADVVVVPAMTKVMRACRENVTHAHAHALPAAVAGGACSASSTASPTGVRRAHGIFMNALLFSTAVRIYDRLR